MKKTVTILIIMIVGIYAEDSWFGSIGPVKAWTKDNSSSQGSHNYQGISVINDSLVWVVGKDYQVWKRTGSVHNPSWAQITSIPNYTNYHFMDVWFVNASTGYVVGYKKNTPNKYRGVAFKTISAGATWSPLILPTTQIETPCLAVCFASAQRGYISCANGKIWKTTNSGGTWIATGSDPWSDNNNLCNWYTGLWTQPDNDTNLWVSGDAFGVISKSTNGGANWTSYQPNELKQTYTFPSGTSAPYDTRLANFDVHYTSANNGYVGLSYGKIGKTTNGGSSWDTIRYEPNQTWFYDVTNDGSSNYTIGNWGAIHQFNGTDVQENINYRWYQDNQLGDYACVDNATSNYIYAAGKGGGATVRKRYQPAVLDSVKDTLYWQGPPANRYVYELTCHVSNEQNVAYYYCTEWLNNYALRQILLLPQTTPSWTFYYDNDYPINAPRTDYYYTVYVSTNDNPIGYQEMYVFKVDSDSLGNLDSLYTPPPVATSVYATDVPNDNGHAIEIVFQGQLNNYLYHIARATDSLGPYYCVKAGMQYPDSTYIDYVQDSIRYYYVVMTTYGAPYTTRASAYTDWDSVTALDNLTPDTTRNSACWYDESNQVITLEWDPPDQSANPDIAGYWVCPIAPDAEGYLLNHAAPINRTYYCLPVESHWQGWIKYYIAAMDYSGHVGNWGSPCSTYIVTTIDTTATASATGINNSRKMVRDGNIFWVCYESSGDIYVKKSTDAGVTWSGVMNIGDGDSPSIFLNPADLGEPKPGVVWRVQDAYDTLYFSRLTSGSSWTTPTKIVTSTGNFGPPSLVIGNDGNCYIAYAEGSTIKYTRFAFYSPTPDTPESVGSGSYPSIGYMVGGLGKPEVHVAWQGASDLIYRSKFLSSGWNAPESLYSSGLHPCLEIVGSTVHVVFEGSSTDIYQCLTTYSGLGGHSWTTRQVNSSNNDSSYPVIADGSVCAWMENIGGSSNEVYQNIYNVTLGWLTPVNISNTNGWQSRYPHIVKKQTVDSTMVYFAWTEHEYSTTPYKIKFKRRKLSGGSKRDEDPDLPYYVADCGDRTPSGFLVQREGYYQYGSDPYQWVDYDVDFLEYEFTHLDPDYEYALEAFLYQEGYDKLPLAIKVNDSQIGTIALPAQTLVSFKKMLPEQIYSSGEFHLKIASSEKAVSSILALYEYEPDEGEAYGGDGPQEEGTSQCSIDHLALNVMPTLARGHMTIQYAVPKHTKVRLVLYDVVGRLVETLTDAMTKPGVHSKTLNTSRLSQGVYFVRIETDTDEIVEKIIMLK